MNRNNLYNHKDKDKEIDIITAIFLTEVLKRFEEKRTDK